MPKNQKEVQELLAERDRQWAEIIQTEEFYNLSKEEDIDVRSWLLGCKQLKKLIIDKAKKKNLDVHFIGEHGAIGFETGKGLMCGECFEDIK